MKLLFLVLPFLIFGCKKPNERNTTEIILNTEEPSHSINENPKLPEGALMADFIGNKDSIYAYVKKIDTAEETTLIGFENEQLPEITVSESIGADLKLLKLKNFKANVLLVNAKLKDTHFNEYYLFVWNGFAWKQPVNRFDIHKSNMTDTLIPIINNPKDSTQLLRYYSVFNMDSESEKKFTWKLMQESIPISDY